MSKQFNSSYDNVTGLTVKIRIAYLVSVKLLSVSHNSIRFKLKKISKSHVCYDDFRTNWIYTIRDC